MYKKLIGFLILVFLLTGCQLPFFNSSKPETEGELKSDSETETEEINKIALVIAPRDFNDQETETVKKSLENQDYRIDLASIQTGTFRGEQGTELAVDLTAIELEPSDYQAIIFIGGSGMNQIVKDETLQMTAQKFYQAEKIVAAIGTAPIILAYSGVLENKKATAGDEAQINVFLETGVDFTGQEVEVDEKVITAKNHQVTSQFILAILNLLN